VTRVKTDVVTYKTVTGVVYQANIEFWKQLLYIVVSDIGFIIDVSDQCASWS
jgi:hypothetical protein